MESACILVQRNKRDDTDQIAQRRHVQLDGRELCMCKYCMTLGYTGLMYPFEQI